MAPEYPDLDFISLPRPEVTYDISVPIEKNNSDCFCYFMLPSNKVIDYVKATFSEPYSLRKYNGAPGHYSPPPHIGSVDKDDLVKSDALYLHLSNYSKFTECEQRIYRLITWLEQEIKLETLIKIKRSVFFTSS